MKEGISFICAVYGQNKFDFIEKLIKSISNEKKIEKEIIFIDQNKDSYFFDFLKTIKDFNSNFSLVYIKSKKGLSKSRNEGIKIARYNFICFPDDDCEYPESTIKRSYDFLKSNPHLSGIIMSVHETSEKYRLRFTNKNQSGLLKTNEIFYNCCSISIFAKNNNSILFDEEFGLGAKYNSCEDYDYILRRHLNGEKFSFQKDLMVLHPDSNTLGQEEIEKKIISNAVGHGALFSKYKRQIFPTLLYSMITPLIGVIIYKLIKQQKSRQYRLLFQSRIKGFLQYEKLY